MDGAVYERRLDDLGRIWIPKDIRRQIGITEGDTMRIEVKDDTVVLRKVTAKKAESHV